jgi:phosphatidylglycerophosphate synthase
LTQSISLGQETVSRVKTQSPIRIQTNLLARSERAVLNWLCTQMPRAVTPDRLTALGACGAAIVLAGYVGSRFNPAFFWLATLGFFIHWFGDSLDGSLARHRRIERPRYGYFLDHTVDALCNLAILGGLGLSAYVRLDVALFVLVGYFLLCMYVFLYNHISGKFQLSFLALGPTELRVGLILINFWMYSSGPSKIVISSQTFSAYDLVFCLVGAAFVSLFAFNTFKAASRLRREDIVAAESKARYATSIQGRVAPKRFFVT